jgi:hypothetical protein
VVLPLQPLELRHRAKHAGCGRARSRNIFFGHVPVVIRQGQRRDAVAKGEERHGRCAAGKSRYIRLYRRSGSKPSRRCTFHELESLAVALRHAWGDGAHCPSGRHGAKFRSLNNHVCFKIVQQNFKFSWARLFQNSGSSGPDSHSVSQSVSQSPKSTPLRSAQQRFLMDPPL